ncbi:MAG TPA: bifunctional 5,10-methylenetetrahydrofolate dehydrogenase/5,10-methenyltetrahydrofolate cyclohydrolase [Candidatus Dormibacteraeota bacterium]|nr:bifunctional 5,10-methylenetetrahydrofolate dehydrogenase/5,10-methenyltetrahydrofolate cyclohydrolase [Candidatus Dormibacteraeota bacterium]
MTAVRVDGREVAGRILADVADRVRARAAAGLRPPHLSVVLVGENEASETYVRGKRRDAERVGMTSSDHRLPASATTSDVVALVDSLNGDPDISGVLVQQPLPPQVDVPAVVEAVDPRKDVDGFHPVSAGRLLLGQPGLVACTPAGILRMLDDYGIELEGRHAVVVGRSNIVGKPVALLLLARSATVTICHSRTVGLPDICRSADVLVVAIGRLAFVEAGWVRPGAAVIDVGVNRMPDGRLGGDVDPAAAEVAGWLTPVPGGVGPVTRAMLLANTCRAEEARRPG